MRRRRCWRFRQNWAAKNPDVVAALVRACARAADFIEQHRAEAAFILARPERIGVTAEIIQRTLDGRLKISPDGTVRDSARYLLVGREEAARPDPVQAAWLYSQMVRWGQTPLSADALRTAMGVFRQDIYEAVLGSATGAGGAKDGIEAFAGPPFDPADIAGHLGAFTIGRWNALIVLPKI